MEGKNFFGGRATVRPLLVTDQPASRPEVRARISSPRGEMAVLADGTTPIRHLAYLELRPGMPRGNHYHKLRHEYFYLISGELTLHLADLDSGASASVQMSTGDLAYIGPGIAHVLKPGHAGQGVEFAAEVFDLTDVYPHALL